MKQRNKKLSRRERIKREVRNNPILLAIILVSVVLASCIFVRASTFKGYTRIYSITGATYFITLNERGWATCMGVADDNYSFVTQFELQHRYRAAYPLPTRLCDRFFAIQIKGDFGWIVGIA